MKVSRCFFWLRKPLIVLALTTLVAYLPTQALSACSDSRVKRLSRLGDTVSAIVRICNMDVDVVRDIIEEDNYEATPAPKWGSSADKSNEPRQIIGLDRGAPLSPCGCWGPVNPGHRQQNQACRSGYAIPHTCTQMCPAGGFAWRGVCG